MLKPAQSHTNTETHPKVKQPFETWLWLFMLPFIKTGQILPEMPQQGDTRHRPITVPNAHLQLSQPRKVPR